jgi:hypothetical protein
VFSQPGDTEIEIKQLRLAVQSSVIGKESMVLLLNFSKFREIANTYRQFRHETARGEG